MRLDWLCDAELCDSSYLIKNFARPRLAPATKIAIVALFVMGPVACGGTPEQSSTGFEVRIAQLERELASLKSAVPAESAAQPSPAAVSEGPDSDDTGAQEVQAEETDAYTAGFADGFVIGFEEGVGADFVPELGNHVMQLSPYDLGWDDGYLRGFVSGMSASSVSGEADAEDPQTVTSAPTTSAPSTAVTQAGPTDEWCAEYRLALEVAGNAKAQSIRDPLTGDQMYFGMNHGMYQEWVVGPLYEAGCEIPAGYLIPEG